jgi:hypothetical protein
MGWWLISVSACGLNAIPCGASNAAPLFLHYLPFPIKRSAFKLFSYLNQEKEIHTVGKCR